MTELKMYYIKLTLSIIQVEFLTEITKITTLGLFDADSDCTLNMNDISLI